MEDQANNERQMIFPMSSTFNKPLATGLAFLLKKVEQLP